MEGYHDPVLLREVLEALGVQPGKWYLDCTLGDGGHSLEILRQGGKVVGIDVDPQSLERAGKRLKGAGYSNQDFILIKGNFRDLKNLIFSQTDTVESKFAGAIFDLGVSSLQLESPERGFSFTKMGPLDMRMDPTLQVRALDLVNALSRKELYELFTNLGEETYAWAMANVVVRTREVKPFTTTVQLAELVERVAGRREKIHPATRVFQALRIAVNDELGAIEEGLNQIIDLLEKNGHIVVISFHSLEDRIVKNTFREWADKGLGKILTKKPLLPGEAEITKNPRSRSAKMRVFQRL